MHCCNHRIFNLLVLVFSMMRQSAAATYAQASSLGLKQAWRRLRPLCIHKTWSKWTAKWTHETNLAEAMSGGEPRVLCLWAVFTLFWLINPLLYLRIWQKSINLIYQIFRHSFSTCQNRPHSHQNEMHSFKMYNISCIAGENQLC